MRYRFLSLQPLREPDTGGGQGGNGGQGGQQPPANDDRQQLQGLLQRHQGDAMAVIATLLSENHGLRDERRQLRGQIPAQGTVVLTAEQAQQWQAYGQLGALADVQNALKERETTAGELKTLKRDLELRDVAAAAGWKHEVLIDIAGDRQFAIKDETKDGKAVKVVYVTDGDKEVAADQHPHFQKFLGALRTEVQQQRPALGTPRQAQPQRQQGTTPEQPRRPARL